MPFSRCSFRAALRLATAAICGVLGACAAPRQAPPAGPDVRIERADQVFALERGVTRVAIDNPWGEINVRSRNEREVAIHAVIQRLPPQFAKAALHARRDGDTLQLEVVFAAAVDAPPAGRVDLAVYLPDDLALAVRTRDGRIMVKKREGAIEAATESGSIDASTRGRLDLHTRSGTLHAKAFGTHWQGVSTLASDTGRIILMVPTFGDIALSAETAGRLSTNFGLSVHPREDGGSVARARYGQGTSPLQVRSRMGEIVLEQLVLMGEDAANPEDDD